MTGSVYSARFGPQNNVPRTRGQDCHALLGEDEMAAGTKTKLLVAVLILVNALVLLNIRRSSPELPRGGYSWLFAPQL